MVVPFTAALLEAAGDAFLVLVVVFAVGAVVEKSSSTASTEVKEDTNILKKRIVKIPEYVFLKFILSLHHCVDRFSYRFLLSSLVKYCNS